MTEQVMESCTELLELVFQYDFGSEYFYIQLGTTVFVLCGITWLLSRTFGGKAGFILGGVAALLPLLFGVVGYGLAETYVVPKITYSSLLPYISWAAFALIFLLTLLVASRKMLGIGAIVTIVVFVMATAASGIAYYGANVLIDMADQGSENAREQKERVIDRIVD